MSELSVNPNAATQPAIPAVSPAALDERQLMQRLRAGDESALQELIHRHGETLARLIGRLTAWHADRDDILQEVLLAVWERSGSFRGDGSLEGWLKRLAINRCRNHFRAASSLKRTIERFVLLAPPKQIVKRDPHHEQDNTELRRALEKLSQADRTALVLFYLEELPGDEVATLLKIKPETLHVRLHRARKKLKRLIEEQSD